MAGLARSGKASLAAAAAGDFGGLPQDLRVTLARLGGNPSDDPAARASLDAIRVSGPEDSLALVKSVLDGVPSPARDIVLLNAGAAIYVSGLTPSLGEGVRWAAAAIDSGEARRRFERLVALTQSFG